MRIDIVTIFPEYLQPLRVALLGKAIDNGIIDLHVHDLREWAVDAHRSVDDAPYGGGPGMVMKPDVWGRALDHASEGTTPQLIVPTPAGRLFDQHLAETFAAQQHLIFACGRYEGIDQRVFDDAAQRMPVDEVSIGDYVLIGGEAASLVMVEAIVRLIPGVLGNPNSALQDSFSDGLLEGPSYTRPDSWRGLDVPAVLKSGDHKKIARWRRDQALIRTAQRRPELLQQLPDDALTKRDRAVLAELTPGTAPKD